MFYARWVTRLTGATVLTAALLTMVVGCPGTTPIPGNLDSGITGIIQAGPQCPVVRPNDPNCADKPLAATVIVKSAATGLQVTQFTSSSDGTFHVPLPPGSYELDPQPGSPSGLPFGAPQTVQVQAGQFTNVTIEYDTGIR